MTEKKYHFSSMNIKPGDRVKYKKSEEEVLAFYQNQDGTYTLNIKGKEYSDSRTRLTDEEIKNIEKI